VDAENRIIPIVEDDQGEGMKDPLDYYDLLKKPETQNDIFERLRLQSEKLKRRRDNS
jgi:hypothetical protein